MKAGAGLLERRVSVRKEREFKVIKTHYTQAKDCQRIERNKSWVCEEVEQYRDNNPQVGLWSQPVWPCVCTHICIHTHT